MLVVAPFSQVLLKNTSPPKQECVVSTELLPGQGLSKSQHNYLFPSCHFPLCRETKPRVLFCNPAKRSCGKQQSIVPLKILHYFPRHLTVFPFRFFLPLSETPERVPCSDTSFWPWLRWLSSCFCLVTWSQLQKDTGPNRSQGLTGKPFWDTLSWVSMPSPPNKHAEVSIAMMFCIK